MARYSGSGWHNQSTRHSNARRTGHAGGYYAVMKNSDMSAKIIKTNKIPTREDYPDYGYAEGKYKTKKEAIARANALGYKISEQVKKQQNSFSRVNKQLRDVNKNSTFDLMMKWESEPTSPAEDMVLFGRLIKNGQIRQLQGAYGRQAQTYIDSGVLDTKGNITQKGKEFIRDEY